MSAKNYELAFGVLEEWNYPFHQPIIHARAYVPRTNRMKR